VDYQGEEIVKKILDIILLFLVALIITPDIGLAQSQSYQLLPAPDIWYNSVDGMRVGGRVIGKVPGTFEDGAHRLNAGFWLGTKIPTYPVSYYFKFTEPIPSISGFQSEASVSVHSSYRTGFQDHGISFNKRWQTGFDEKNYKELSVGFRTEHRFDDEYLLYNQLWQNQWLFLVGVNAKITDESSIGRYILSYSADANVGGKYPEFLRTEISFQENIPLSKNFSLTGRLYSGFATRRTAPEYLFSHSLGSARTWMHSGLTRARGTIPPAWVRGGNIQVTGGANLRGYLHQDIVSLNQSGFPLFTSISAANFDLVYPNPIGHALANIPVLGKFVNLKSYLFFDAGTSLGLTRLEEHRSLFDAGPGFTFSINIPDYLGKPRGFRIRYDLPLWVSKPGSEKSFKFRNVIGIGAVISL